MRNRLALILALLFVAGCDKKIDLNSSPEYRSFVGKKFRTVVDLVFIDVKGERGDLELEQPGSSGIPSVSEMKSFPFNAGNISIAGLFPKGSILEIRKLQKFQSTEYSTVDVFVGLGDESPFKAKTIRANLILVSIPGRSPEINLNYVEAVAPMK